MAERVSSAPRLRDRPAKGDEKLLEISAKRGTTFAPPSPPFFLLDSPLNKARLSFSPHWVTFQGEEEKRRGKKKKKKEKRFKQGAPKWHRADKLRYIMLDEAPTARVPTYVQRRGDVDLWRVSIIDPYIRRSKRSVSFGTDRKE